MNWTARARAHFLDKRPNPTDETDEAPLSSVSSVPIRRFHKKQGAVFVALEAGTPPANDDAGLLHALLEAAMRAWDHHDTDEPARAQMRADILATPEHHRADLLAHFTQAYRGKA